MPDNSTDNRKYTRLPLDIVVEIRLADDKRLYGETADISLDGAFVVLIPPPGIETGQACNLELIIKTNEGWVRVGFNCSIVHLNNDGIGLQFDAAEIPHHESFLKLLIDGCSDVNQLLEELSHHPRKDFQFSGR